MNYASSKAQGEVQRHHVKAEKCLRAAAHWTGRGDAVKRAECLQWAAESAEQWAKAIRECIDQPPKTRKART